jgi:uncharacterized protein YjcR
MLNPQNRRHYRLVELARIYNVHPNTIVKWKAELMGHARRA